MVFEKPHRDQTVETWLEWDVASLLPRAWQRKTLVNRFSILLTLLWSHKSCRMFNKTCSAYCSRQLKYIKVPITSAKLHEQESTSPAMLSVLLIECMRTTFQLLVWACRLARPTNLLGESTDKLPQTQILTLSVCIYWSLRTTVLFWWLQIHTFDNLTTSWDFAITFYRTLLMWGGGQPLCLSVRCCFPGAQHRKAKMLQSHLGTRVVWMRQSLFLEILPRWKFNHWNATKKSNLSINNVNVM